MGCKVLFKWELLPSPISLSFVINPNPMFYSRLNQAGFLHKVFLPIPSHRHKTAVSSFVFSLLDFNLGFTLIVQRGGGEAEGGRVISCFLGKGKKNKPLILGEEP